MIYSSVPTVLEKIGRTLSEHQNFREKIQVCHALVGTPIIKSMPSNCHWIIQSLPTANYNCPPTTV